MHDPLVGAERKVEEAIDLLLDEKTRLEQRIALIDRKVEGYRAVLLDTGDPSPRPTRPRQPASEHRPPAKRGPAVRPTDGPYAGMSVKDVVGQVLAENPALTPHEIRDILAAGGYPLVAKSPLNTVFRAMQTIEEDNKRNGTGKPD